MSKKISERNKSALSAEDLRGHMRVSPRNPTGFKGVRKKRNKWESFLYSKGKGYYLGTFNSPEEASAAYLAKAREIYGEFARAA